MSLGAGEHASERPSPANYLARREAVQAKAGASTGASALRRA